MSKMKKGFEVVKETAKEFVREEDGVGVVEIILILVVLVALVVVFRDKISVVVNNALGSVEKNSTNLTK